MDAIELECPHCNARLELDAGFAGGVCRCSECGMLMTVPADPARRKAARAARPDRPDAPPAGGVAAPRREASRPARPARTQGPPVAGSRPSSPPASPAPEDAAGPPTEAVEAEAEPAETTPAEAAPRARVPLARVKRKAVRLGVAAALGAAAVGLVVVVLLALAIATRDPAGTSSAQQQAAAREARGNYDIEANPFLLQRPNFLGLPLASRVAFAIDAGRAARGWLPLAKDALAAAADRGGDGVELQAVFWTEGSPRAFPDAPQKMDAAHRGQLRAFLDGIEASGAAAPGPAVAAAAAGKPQRIILVAGQPPLREALDAVAAAVKSPGTPGVPGPALDAVLIGDDSPGLKALAESTGGHYLNVPQSRLNTWSREADEKKAKDERPK